MSALLSLASVITSFLQRFIAVVSTRFLLFSCFPRSRMTDRGQGSTHRGLKKRKKRTQFNAAERERGSENIVVRRSSLSTATPLDSFSSYQCRTSRTPSSRRPTPPRARERASATLASPGPPFSVKRKEGKPESFIFRVP